MAYLTGYQYYNDKENWGSYQYVALKDIVNNFMLQYVGNDKLVNNVERYNVIFHAKRAIQNLHYDALKETKVISITVDDKSTVILPPDFVNWVRISLYRNGSLIPLVENNKTNYAGDYLQAHDLSVLFDEEGSVLEGTSVVDLDRINGMQKTEYLGSGRFNGNFGYNIDGRWIFDFQVGARFGLNTETANQNPTFKINKAAGVINFDSTMIDEDVVIEYISDGMEGGDDTKVMVNKFFEDYIYAYIKWAILNSKLGVQEYVIRRAHKEKSALLANAKIRLSNISPARLLMAMRGSQKWLK